MSPPDRNATPAPRSDDNEIRLRVLETDVAVLKSQLVPILALAGSMATLGNAVNALDSRLSGLKGMIYGVGALATVAGPLVAELIHRAFK